VECAICMDDIHFTKNCVTTECGHCFHASCLMKNVAHNGFGCPYCRTVMAEQVEENDDDSDSNYSSQSEEMEAFDDYALRGFRFFMNNLEGDEHDHEDNLEEQEDMEDMDETDNVAEVVKPSPAFITQKLVEQGITMESLVKSLLIDHEEYDEESAFIQINDTIFGKLRVIISNYTPAVIEQPITNTTVAHAPPAPAPAPAPVPAPATFDHDAQPKNVTMRQHQQQRIEFLMNI